VCLCTPLDQDHDFFLIFFEHQTNHATYFNARGQLSESVFDDLLGTLFLIKSIPNLLFAFLFLNHHIGHATHSDARILLYLCVLAAL
jgi:hypothetical protein